MVSAYIRTIEELEQLYYTNKGAGIVQETDINSPFITKADEPVISTTTGVYNAVYGAQAWVQLNQEANTFGALPKSVWRRSGWRVISARSQNLPYGGVSETGTIPETSKPTFAEVSTKPKLLAVSFENSEIQEFLAQHEGDDAYAAMHQLRMYFASEHREDINAMLNTANETLAGNNTEGIDRVTGSYDEVTNGQESDQSTAYTAGDLDIYGLDRDAAATWADGYTAHNGTSGVRSLTDTLLQDLVQNTLANGANHDGQWFQTGWDTWSVINQLYDPQVRYNLIGQANIKPGVNGIESVEGRGVGLQVAQLFHAPVINSKNTTSETGGISRVYLLDTSNPEGFDLPRLSFRIAKPTQYFEAGINQGTPFAVDKFGTEGLYRTMGEMICTFFATQGKLRDLSA